MSMVNGVKSRSPQPFAAVPPHHNGVASPTSSPPLMPKVVVNRKHNLPWATMMLAAVSCILLLLQLSQWGTAHSSSRCMQTISTQAKVPAVDKPPEQLKAADAAPQRLPCLNASSKGTGPTAAAPVLLGGPPYRFPTLIHQTVVNKSRLSCEEKRVIESWKTLNPNHTHRLWDDHEMRQFVLQYYPHLVPVPYDLLLTGTERSDLWRVLVLNTLGGVYADMDVECLKPIDEWNAQHGHDAAVLLGVENFDAKRKPHTVHVNNWAMAAMPGHPLLARFPGVVTREIQKQYFELVAQKGQMKPLQYEKGILDRTGPAAVTTAMYEYLESVGLGLNKVSEADLTGSGGVIAGGVRVLPGVALSTGWEVADARSKGVKYTCADAAAAKPQALVCHMFWGSWRSTWRTFKQRFTYENC